MKKFKLMYKIFAGLMISCSAFVYANATIYSSEGYESEKNNEDTEVKAYVTDMFGNPIDENKFKKNEINLEEDKKNSENELEYEFNIKDKSEENELEYEFNIKYKSEENEINLNKINLEKDKKIPEDGLKNKLKELYPTIDTKMNHNETKIEKNFKDYSDYYKFHLDIETGENINKIVRSKYGELNYKDNKKKINNLFSKARSYSKNDEYLTNCSDQINNLYLVTKRKALNRNLPLKNKIYNIFLEYVNVLETLRNNINILSINFNKSDEDKYLKKADEQKELMNDIFEKTILDFEKTFNSISKIMYGREYNLIKYFHDDDYKKIPFKEYKKYINYKDFKDFLNNEKDEDTKKLFKKLHNLIIEEIENLKAKLKIYIFSQLDKKVPYEKIIKNLSLMLNINDKKTMTLDEYKKNYSIKDKDETEKKTIFFNLGSFDLGSDEKNENKNSNDSESESENKYDRRKIDFIEYATEIINVSKITDENMKNKIKNMFNSMIKIDKLINPKNDDNQDDNINFLIDAMNDNMNNDNKEYDILFTDDSDDDFDDQYINNDEFVFLSTNNYYNKIKKSKKKDDYKKQKETLKKLFDNSNKDK